MSDTTSPPVGLDAFVEHTDVTGKVWWYRHHEGWEVFARPVTAVANREVFPMQIGHQPVANFGVNLDESTVAKDGFEVRSNSDRLTDLILDRKDERQDTIEQSPVVPPWNRPLPEPSLAIDFTGLILPAVILGACIVAAVLIRTFAK